MALMRHPLNNDKEDILNKHIDFIISKSLNHKYGYHCWNAHNFPVQTTREYQVATMPGIIGTEICASTIFEYYKIHAKRPCLKKILLSTRDFFLNELLVQKGHAIYFKYKPISPEYECIYNASLIAAKYIAKVNYYFSEQDGNDVIRNCFRYIISKQNVNGSWYYGLNLRSGHQKKQIDFHQGFILDSLLEYLDLVDADRTIFESYLKGLEFYYSKQFNEEGWSLYRYPRRYPVDIHNQSQGIITFSKAGRIDEKYLKFAKTIAEWTINNMRDDSGVFLLSEIPFYEEQDPVYALGTSLDAKCFISLFTLFARRE